MIIKKSLIELSKKPKVLPKNYISVYSF